MEPRLLLYGLSGREWSSTDVSVSLLPDGTSSEGYASSLYAELNAVAPQKTWQRQLARALQTWANASNLNFHFVTDDGSPTGVSGLSQGDSRFGDIRLGAHPLSGYVAYAYYPSSTTKGGDITINPNYTFKVGTHIDLYSVLLHETGHALGLDHSTSGTIMYPTITGVYTGLKADDIAGVRAMYGARRRDSYDAAGGNDSLASASSLALASGVLDVRADLTSLADVDYYRLDLPSGADGTLTVSVDARGTSLLSPRVKVFDAMGSLLASGQGDYGSTASVRLDSLAGGQAVYVAADGRATGVFGMGAYRLRVEHESEASEVLNFDDYEVLTYGGEQDYTGSVKTENKGSTLHMKGNRWKRIDLAYAVTPETVLEFDYKSTAEGEVHAIGLDSDLSIDAERTFQLHGTQAWGRLEGLDYSGSVGGYKHYRIPVGQFHTGEINHLFFVNDHDVAGPSADSYFSNVRLYESGSLATEGVSASASPAQGESTADEENAEAAGEEGATDAGTVTSLPGPASPPASSGSSPGGQLKSLIDTLDAAASAEEMSSGQVRRARFAIFAQIAKLHVR